MADLANPWDGGQWPHQLTSDLESILGRPNFTFISFSQLYRKAGFEIARRSEAEQAFFMHRFLGHWFARGDEWRDSMAEEMEAVQALAAAAEGEGK